VGPLGFVLGVVSLSFNVGNEIHVPVGGGRGPLMMSGLGPSETASALPDEEIADHRHHFYFRQIESVRSRVSIPLRPQGAFSVAGRMDSTVRTRVDLSDGDAPPGGSFVTRGPWSETRIGGGVRPGPLEFTLGFKDAPLVQRSDPENFRRYVDELVFRSDQGFELPWVARIAGGVLVLLLVLITQSASPGAAAVLLSVIGPGVLSLLLFLEPVAVSLALPRLLGFVLLAAVLIRLLGLRLNISRASTAVLTLLGSAMILVYGFLSFLPNHSPADLDIHIWRTVDLATVPSSYDAWLLYGSHYPTASQARGAATEALGEGPLIPYSPLPYIFFYAGHAAGLDLHWSMNAMEATSLALLLPLIFALARAASSEAGGLLAAALMALDLATVHHLGRAHSPAVVGGALGLAGLLGFGLALFPTRESPQWKVGALLLGLGALGYSSTPLFYALFGIAMLAFVCAQQATRSLARPIFVTLCAGGIIALVLFYGHYIPGLIRGGGGSALTSDPFPGRTFFIFNNESRQSLRLWRLGLFIPFLAAIPAAWLVMTRCPAVVRAFLLAWWSAWAGIMLLKEPWALPRLLRWAKEDFYVAPSLTLMIAIAIARIESRPLRIGLTAASLMTAAFLRARDYGFHADTLRFVR
jgi:hypothetical protein